MSEYDEWIFDTWYVVYNIILSIIVTKLYLIFIGTHTKLKLNWATGGHNGVFKYESHPCILYLIISSNAAPSSPEFSLFVGDLGLQVTDDILLVLDYYYN